MATLILSKSERSGRKVVLDDQVSIHEVTLGRENVPLKGGDSFEVREKTLQLNKRLGFLFNSKNHLFCRACWIVNTSLPNRMH